MRRKARGALCDAVTHSDGLRGKRAINVCCLQLLCSVPTVNPPPETPGVALLPPLALARAGQVVLGAHASREPGRRHEIGGHGGLHP